MTCDRYYRFFYLHIVHQQNHRSLISLTVSGGAQERRFSLKSTFCMVVIFIELNREEIENIIQTSRYIGFIKSHLSVSIQGNDK